MRLHALRGAISVEADDADEILARTTELMHELLRRNALRPEDVVSCIFTATPDLKAAFPAAAARQMGFDQVPLMCAVEIDVPGALPKIIRVMAHYYAAADDHRAQHVYLGRATALRKDLASAQ
ncbi:chorismate mutase [Patulibacter sp. SYSU D01012]|uniref:chorismate mutase n=1 Tax=Patulibacter sp. SYSU D01012 TaxID=2817381 RepID=UPI001B30F2C5|nr:chorismate mutase [Patulibacter sp. SYSU D01012]